MNRLETNGRKSLILFHAVWGLCWYNFLVVLMSLILPKSMILRNRSLKSLFKSEPKGYSYVYKYIHIIYIHIEFDTYTLAFSIQFWSFCLLDLAGVAEVSFEFPDTETWRKKRFLGALNFPKWYGISIVR